MSKLFQSEPLLVLGILAALALVAMAVVLHISGTPLSAVKDTAAVLTPVLVAVIGRSFVVPLGGSAPKGGA